MQIKLYYRLIIKDKDGNIIRKTRQRKCKSFVIGFLQHIDMMLSALYGNDGPAITIKDTSNTNRTIRSSSFSTYYSMSSFAPDNNQYYGVVVGTGLTSPTNNNYALETQIAHGTGAGQLDYGAHSRTAAAVVGSNVDYIISRSFYNGSGGTIVINEIGLICYTKDSAGTERLFLLIRDVITPIAVYNTQTVTAQYTLRTTV